MYNIFILGAGFSKPAGLPLCDELFKEVLIKSKKTHIYQNILEKDISNFLEYYNKTHDNSITESEINFEEFISYLDIEHYLSLKGSDTWSDEGNRSQIAIRNLIAHHLLEKINSMDKNDWKLYEYFVEYLDPGDIVITFNYDNIIEKCLEKANRPYKLFLNKLSVNKEEAIILLKMHGSIDWFDFTNYERSCHNIIKEGSHIIPKHNIFCNRLEFNPKKIINNCNLDDSLPNNIYKVNNLERYFQIEECSVRTSPFILSPSYNKILYMGSLRELWHSFNSAGSLNEKVAIIGFSLPKHDDYIKQPLFSLVDNFQNFYTDNLIKKSKLKIVDYQQTENDINKFKRNYSFVNWDKTDVYFDGFCKEAIDMIFEEE